MMLSRSTTFMRSMSPCSRMKMGAAFLMVTAAMASTTTVTAASSRPIWISIMQAMMMPTTHRNGRGSTIWIVAMMDCWITLMSFSDRVIMDPVPKRSKSPPENARELS